MLSKPQFFLATALGLSLSGPLLAEGFYAGVGVSSNELTTERQPFDKATGFQVFAGYDFGPLFQSDRLSWQLEAGYFSSGDFEGDTRLGSLSHEAAQGLWSAAVLDVALSDRFSLFARGGFDAGDDSGALLGVGAALAVGAGFRLSGELITRENVDSFQLNLSTGF